MTATAAPSLLNPEVQARFLALILPHIESHAQVVFRHVKCQDKKADAIQEMVALSWKWTCRLFQLGKDPTEFPTTLATYAAKAVKSGRRLAGMERPKDVLSPRAQQLHGFTVEPLNGTTATLFLKLYSSPQGQRRQDAFEERLRDNTITPVPDQVSFRLDFPAWLKTRTERDRRVIEDLLVGERTMDVADKHGLTAGRISQLRRDFMEDWRHFCGEYLDSQPPA